MDVLGQTFSNTADIVFGIDTECRITFWNDRCRKFFNRPFEDVRLKKCAEILAGTNLDGSRLCGPDCHIAEQVKHGWTGNDYDLVVKDQGGASVLMNVGVYFTPEKRFPRGGTRAFLALRPVDCYRFLQRMTGENRFKTKESASRVCNLTRRELEVLELVSGGLGSAEIAERFFISPSTVKNHLRNILEKLNVHSRAEAAALALRRGFFR
jgi:DNA-binding CsgD family transcriptional regulator